LTVAQSVVLKVASMAETTVVLMAEMMAETTAAL
jgi:hypothetical protein